MTTRTKFWLKFGATLLFVAVEIFTFHHSVLTAFERPSVNATAIAIGSQFSLILWLGCLWFGGSTRATDDAGWGSLAMFTLIVTLS
jgi:hypothetical protein